MRSVTKSLTGFFAGMLGTGAMLALVYFTAWAKDGGPSISVDSTPINRDIKSVTSFAPVIKKAAPSVVNIYSTQIIHMRPFRLPFQDDPFFRHFFGDQFPGGNRQLTRREESLGSGVIVSPDGYILTANHVVQGADEIKVSLGNNNGKEYTAKVIGGDPVTDVAVLKIDASGLPAITLGDSDQLEVGDVVLALGNPFGVGQSVTMGIVSALGRRVSDSSPTGGYSIQDFIQTDAAINPGNSGGALVDAEGRLIGINTMIKSSSYGNEGVGFAVPINLARHVMNRLISGGNITHAYLGIKMQNVTADLADEFNVPSQSGVLVDDVMPDSPASRAGIKSGDVITAFNGKKVQNGQDLQLAVSESAPGVEATVKLIRNGDTKELTVKLAPLPGEASGEDNGQGAVGAANADQLNGVTVDDLSSDVRQQLQIPDDVKGAIVTQVDPESNAADAGLQANDVIVEINHHSVANADEAVKICNQATGKRILLKIWRRDGNMAGMRFLSVDNSKPTK
jgi:serine protease Do